MKRENDALIENIQDLKRRTQEEQMRAPKMEIRERERVENEGQNGKLQELGKRQKPKNTSYMASYCVHIYKDTLTSDAFFITQMTEIQGGIVPAALAQKAFQELGVTVMDHYGIKPPRKRGEDGEAFREKSPLEI